MEWEWTAAEYDLRDEETRVGIGEVMFEFDGCELDFGLVETFLIAVVHRNYIEFWKLITAYSADLCYLMQSNAISCVFSIIQLLLSDYSSLIFISKGQIFDLLSYLLSYLSSMGMVILKTFNRSFDKGSKIANL